MNEGGGASRTEGREGRIEEDARKKERKLPGEQSQVKTSICYIIGTEMCKTSLTSASKYLKICLEMAE